MKKINYFFASLLLFCGVASANKVTPETAKTVAVNFCSQNNIGQSPSLTLAYTESSAEGQPVYYVYNINSNNGFVIVSAEDAAHPILGCSNTGQFVIPKDNNNFAWWMNCRKQEIEYARTNNITSTSDITNEWNGFINNNQQKTHSIMSSVSPLIDPIAWDQGGYYNAMCPGGSVTGCVATCMAQIMRYWQYPSHGHGSSGYYDEQLYGFTSNYGYLKANYDTSNYVWSAMPVSVSSQNNEVAKLMYDCGVSVDMDYSTGESGAYVISGDYPVSAESAFVQNFGYDPNTIQGLYQSKYTLPNWTNIITNELNNKRPVEYVGFDSISPNNAAGHTWVCDGYNTSGLFHMNWGWSGSNNGYFTLSALNAGGYKFNWWNEALVGIEPPAASPYFVATPTFGCTGMNVQFTDQTVIDSNLSITNRTWLFPGGTPPSSGALNPSVIYNTPGVYDVSLIISDARGTDTLTKKAYIGVATQGNLPLKEDFQSTFPPAGWYLNNPNNYSYQWQVNVGVGGYGASSQSMEFNNCQGYQWWAPPGKAGIDIIGQRQQIYTNEYDFTSVPSPKMYFDVAYAPYNATYSDTLVIYYSLDCGKTFTQIYAKGGTTLNTTGKYVTTGADTNNLGCFSPLSNNWRTDTIHIPAISGKNGVLFSFENRSGNGSPLYIDNINISGVPTGVSAISSTPSVKVFPNPNAGQFNIALQNISGTPYLKIYNVLGQEVYQSHLKNDNNPINLSAQSKGIYIYRIFSETGSAISTGRLVIE